MLRNNSLRDQHNNYYTTVVNNKMWLPLITLIILNTIAIPSTLYRASYSEILYGIFSTTQSITKLMIYLLN